MARPKGFDREEALERAMRCFWARGYDATSLDDLVRETGVGRQSLYNEFGDKRAIYLAALERYAESENEHLVTVVQEAASGRAAIAELLAAVIAQSTKDPDKGCMLGNAAIEMAARDAQVKQCVTTSTGALVRAIERRLRRARDAGELAEDRDPQALARFFVATIAGLRMTAKTSNDRRILESIARVALGVLD